jgi:hypothetical protein
MRLFAMHQVAVEMMRVVRFDRRFIRRSIAVDAAEYMRGVMIDDHDHSTGAVGCSGRPFR